MTAPTEPLVMTLEEANEAILTDGWMIRPSGNGTRPWELVEVEFTHRNDIGLLYTWEEAAEIALGRPVVAHDPAAELRAAIVEWSESTKAFLRVMDDAYPYPDDIEELQGRALAADDALHALAATEGQP